MRSIETHHCSTGINPACGHCSGNPGYRNFDNCINATYDSVFRI